MCEMDKGQMRKPQPRQHHYVPVTYLSRFADKDTLCVFDLGKKKEFRASTSNILKIRNFYAIDLPDNRESFVLETDLFGQIEAKSKPVLDEYLRTMVGPRGSDWEQLCKFVASLEVRTVGLRQTHWEMAQYFNDLIAWSVLSKSDWFEHALELAAIPDAALKEEALVNPHGLESPGLSLQKPQRDFVRHLQALNSEGELTYERAKVLYESSGYAAKVPQNDSLRLMVKLLPQMTAILQSMTPVLLMAPGQCRFVTSDDPLVRANPSHQHHFSNGLGLLCKGIEVYVPLSPLSCLMFKHGGQPEALAIGDDYVSYLNTLQGIYCYRFVVSRDSRLGWRTKSGKVSFDSAAFVAELSQCKPRKTMEMSGGPVPKKSHTFNLGMVRRDGGGDAGCKSD